MAPAASEALIKSWRYSRASEYSLRRKTLNCHFNCGSIFTAIHCIIHNFTSWMKRNIILIVILRVIKLVFCSLTHQPGWHFSLHAAEPHSTEPSPGGVL